MAIFNCYVSSPEGNHDMYWASKITVQGIQGWQYKTILNQHITRSSHIIWVNYNELTTSSLEIIVSKGNHPQMALIQVSELL